MFATAISWSLVWVIPAVFVVALLNVWLWRKIWGV